MHLPEPQNTFSWNALAPFIAMLIAAAIAWGVAQNSISTLREDVDRLRENKRQAVAELRTQQQIDARLISRLEERLAGIAATQARTEQGVAEINRFLRQTHGGPP